MATLLKDNPCFGCQSSVSERRAPCCHDNMLRLSVSEYNAHFKGKPNVIFIQYSDDQWMGEGVIIQNTGSCMNLDQQSGLCNIENNKPLSCRDMEPEEHPLCRKTPGGRQ